MASKKTLLAISGASLVTVVAAGCIVSFGNGIVSAKGDTNFGITFDSNTNILNDDEELGTGSADVISRTGAPFVFDYSNIARQNEASYWQIIEQNGYFSTTVNNTYGFKNKMNGLESATFNFSNSGAMFKIYFSNDGNFSDSWSRDFVSVSGMEQTIEFEGHPHYFKVVNTSNKISTIKSLNIKYSCDAAADKTWEDNHGVNPVISGDTMTYGLFPQTHVNDDDLIAALEEKATALGVADEEYFWYNDEYYVRDIGNSFGLEYTFSDGTTLEDEETYYFKCEPITWNICETFPESGSTTYTVDTVKLLYAHKFHDNTYSEGDNAYANSEVKTWLEDDFYNNAFLSSSYIQETDLTDINPVVTNAKVWIGSSTQYTGESGGWSRYDSESKRCKKVTDFSLCNYAYCGEDEESIGNGYYWNRDKDDSTYDVCVVDEYGNNSWYQCDFEELCIAPALRVKI